VDSEYLDVQNVCEQLGIEAQMVRHVGVASGGSWW
jgi:hypothetical protein